MNDQSKSRGRPGNNNRRGNPKGNPRLRRNQPRNPPGTPARKAAFRMLVAVMRDSETLDQAMGHAASELPGFADRALARAIAGETLRWLVDLDALIDSATKNPLAEDAKPRMVLRMMLAQWLRLDTPPHAVVATGLALLEGGPRRLAHGVFSTLTKKEVTLPDAPTLPAAVRDRWGTMAQKVVSGLALPPPLDLSLKDVGQTAEWAEKLGGESLAPGHIRLPRGGNVEELPGFESGDWWVQDLAASLPARMLGEGGGKRVLDLCAAPGGKTLQLAAAGWDVTALDISGPRLKFVRQNLAHTGLEAELVKADALHWEPEEPFDAILLDAPCSATGTCRRHPDVLHRIGPKQIAETVKLQRQLIEKAAGWLKPGGTLVYAVCSLERAEGKEQVQTAADLKLQTAPIEPSEVPAGLQPTSEGWLQTHPGMLPEEGGLDGFFIARWRK